MQAIPKDYQPEEPKAFPDGKYKANAIKWFSLDDRQNPVLIYQKDGRMVARCRFAVEGHDSGPPMSIEMTHLSMLVKAFGGDVERLPVLPPMDSPGLVSQYLVAVENAINNSGKSVVIDVSNGWVDLSGIPGMELLGYFYFKYDGVDINRKTGKIEPIEGQWGPYFFTRWKVLAGEGGSQIPFVGAVFSEFSNYAVDVVDGKPDWKRTEGGGGYTSAAVGQARMMMITAPDMFDDTYTAKNPYNLIPEWDELARKKSQVLKGVRSRSEKGRVRIDWGQVEPVYNFVSPGAVSEFIIPQTEKKSTFVSQVPVLNQDAIDAKARLIVKGLIAELANGEAFVSGTFDLTTEGKVTAKTYLGPLKDSGVVPHGIIKNLKFEEVKAILDNIKVPDEYSDKLTGYKHELAAIGIGAEDGADF